MTSRRTTDRAGAWERVIIASDLHGVFLDRKCWKVMLAILKDNPVDRVILNGDFMDCTTISDHVQKVRFYQPEAVADYSFDYELAMVHEEILRPLRRAIGKQAKLQLRLGNHEVRFLKPNKGNAAALAEIIETCNRRRATQLEDLLRLDVVGATLSYNAIDSLYGFTLLHGVKTSANAAKANLLRYGNGTSGHSHRGNSFTQKMHGTLAGWWESCCLRTIEKVEYLPHGDSPDWCQGFVSLVINRNNGHFFAKTHFIIDGQCEFGGTIYSA